MRFGTWLFAVTLLGPGLATWTGSASAQCAPAPDSSYFFRDLTQRRAAAKLTDDRAFFERLVSATFANRAAFIEDELTAEHTGSDPATIAVRNFSLLEHRKGFVVVSYQLVDGKADHWYRDVYQVEAGQWRLASSEIAPSAAPSAAR
jgi:hypothetical protein